MQQLLLLSVSVCVIERERVTARESVVRSAFYKLSNQTLIKTSWLGHVTYQD